MSESSDNVDSRLAPKMEYFGERLNRVFAFFFCALEFDGDEDLHADLTQNSRAWRLQTIENACIDTTLIALRDLNDFLTTRTPQTMPDDIRASDFGYQGSHTFLTQVEKEKINKLVAHTTTLGAASQGFRWDILELASKGVSQCIEFLRWVENKHGLTQFNLYTSALVIRKQSEAQLAFIRGEAEKRRSNSPRKSE